MKTPITYLSFMSDINLVQIDNTQNIEALRNNPLIEDLIAIPFNIKDALTLEMYRKRVNGNWFSYDSKKELLDRVKAISKNLIEKL